MPRYWEANMSLATCTASKLPLLLFVSCFRWETNGHMKSWNQWWLYSDGSWGFFKLGHLDFILLLLDFFHFIGQGLHHTHKLVQFWGWRLCVRNRGCCFGALSSFWIYIWVFCSFTQNFALVLWFVTIWTDATVPKIRFWSRWRSKWKFFWSGSFGSGALLNNICYLWPWCFLHMHLNFTCLAIRRACFNAFSCFLPFNINSNSWCFFIIRISYRTDECFNSTSTTLHIYCQTVTPSWWVAPNQTQIDKLRLFTIAVENYCFMLFAKNIFRSKKNKAVSSTSTPSRTSDLCCKLFEITVVLLLAHFRI